MGLRVASRAVMERRMRNAEWGVRNRYANSEPDLEHRSTSCHSAFRIPHLAFSSRRPPNRERHIMAAEPEGIRQGHVHRPLHDFVGRGVEVAGGIGRELV